MFFLSVLVMVVVAAADGSNPADLNEVTDTMAEYFSRNNY